MTYRRLAVCLTVLTILPLIHLVAAIPPGFEDTLVASVESPTALAFTPDGRLLITSQRGELRVVQNGTLLPTPVLDLSSRLCNNSERGLLGVAVDPAFTSNRFVYVYYTLNKSGVCEQNTSRSPVNRVARFVLPDSNVIDTGTETVLVDNIPSPNGNHNGGDLHFGKDGYLYVSIGDGGCDYLNNSGCAADNDASRDQNVLLGKVLRITRDGGIPPDNPFQGSGTARCNVDGRTTAGLKCQETYAWGFRNPFRFSVDPNASSTRIFVNDVGQSTWEEIDLLQPGADYGWNLREGFCAEGSTSNCGAPPPGLTNPVYAYGHGSGCASITGGAFVPNGVWPAEYEGAYLFGDYVCGKLFTLREQGNGSYVQSDFVTALGNNSATAMIFGPHEGTQALYYTSYANGGEVHRIAYASNRTPIASATGSPTTGGVPLTVTFDASSSVDPDGDSMTFDWDFRDGTPHGASAVVNHTYTAAGEYDAVVTVTDSHGASASKTVHISVGDTAPVPQITEPAQATRFTVGQTYTLRGTATDAEDGTLPASALSWTILLHHDSHTHPFLGPVTGTGITFTAPAPEDLQASDTSYLEIYLTATDSAGASTTLFRRFDALRVNVTLNTDPAGRTISVNNMPFVGPTTVTSWAGYVLRLDAGTQDASGQSWLPTGWSDGGTPDHTVVTPAQDVTYTASFSAATRLAATADAHVRGGSYASTNFGTRQVLEIQQSGTASDQREGYLRFDVGSMPSIGAAKVRLYAAIADSRSINLPVTIQAVQNATWSETALTWNNRPAPTTGVLATATILDTIPRWYEWDVTSYVQAERSAGRNAVTFVLRSTTASLPYIGVVAREYSDFDPELLVGAAAGVNHPPTASATGTPLSGAAPLVVSLNASASSDPDGDPLTFDWNFMDGTAHAASASVTHTFTAAGQYDAVVTVTDSHGESSRATVRVTVSTPPPSNTPPVPQIAAPGPSAQFAVGDQVTLVGSATDAEQGSLPDSALSWSVIVHHDTHTHQLLGPTAGNGISFVTPAPENLAAAATSYLEIRLTATDNLGASATVTQRFDPKTVSVTMETSPSGFPFSANGVAFSGPATVTSWAGYVLNLAAATVDQGGQAWLPTGWSDGGAPSHQIVTPNVPATYTLTFAAPVRIGVSADTFARGGSYASRNFGTQRLVELMQSGTAANSREGFLRFDLSTVATIGAARIRVYGGIVDTRSSNVPVVVYGAAAAAWTETGLTWNNRPAATTGVLATTTFLDSTPRRYEWDVTSYLRSEKAAGRNVVTLVIRAAAASVPVIGFATKEYGTFPPELLVTAEPGPASASLFAPPTTGAAGRPWRRMFVAAEGAASVGSWH